ncbi:MAG: sulfatase [Verrucomicrobiota bacterium]
MKFILLFAALGIALLRPVSASDSPNILLLCIDDLRPELACYGVDYIQSPNIDALAASGRMFSRHYVQAPTCGASRYALLTGRYGIYGNMELFNRAKRLEKNPQDVPPSMPAWFRQHGYTTVSVGKVSHHPGGRGGPDWNDPQQAEMPNSWDRHLMTSGDWQHPRGIMHGLAHGEIREDPKQMDVFQSAKGNDEIYPDGLITNEALQQMRLLAANTEKKPFFLAVGLIRPHLPFGAPAKYMDAYRDAQLPDTPHPDQPQGKTTWHKSGEFMRYNRWGTNPNDDEKFALQVRKHYAACVTYADTLVGRILKQLDDLKLRDNTIIVLWGDHGWHLGEQAVWGKHTLFEESLRSPLIITYPGMAQPGVNTASIVETIDIFPTLCDLTKLQKPDFLNGTSLLPILKQAQTPGHPAYSYKGNTKTIRTDTHRLIAHKDGHLELYDHSKPDGETHYSATSDPDTAKALLKKLQQRMP